MNSQVIRNKISKRAPKRFYIQTLGCKVNQYESQAMREILIKAGFKDCLSKEIADIYIINTCTVTRHADKESRHLIGMFHRTNPKASIVVTGCYVEKNADDILFLPGVAHIVKNDEKSRIADILIDSQTRSQANPSVLSITGFKGRAKAFLKIQDGCGNKCSYCKVPLVRGAAKSKPLDNIVKEVKSLVANGFKEIILAGICLGAWGVDIFPSEIAKDVGSSGANLVDVLKALERLNGDFRIRLSSIEPKYVTDELIEFMSGSRRLCRHFHIPLQSGDDEILKLMNRPYSAAEYRYLTDKLRHVVPDIAITTDVMVGFPGERDVNFKNTMNFIKAILPARTHIFKFSKREGTPAYEMKPDIDENVVRRRYNDLKTVALMSSYIYRSTFVGKVVEVLAETNRDKFTGLLTGYSANYIKVLFDGPDRLMGNIAPVRMDDTNLTYTIGSLLEIS